MRRRTRSATILGEYLWARRSQVQPETVGLTREPNRRVPGLRREEVAKLAAISPEYYLRLEQGNDKEPSDQVLRGLARALVLDADAELYLMRLRAVRQPIDVIAPDASVPSVPDGVRRLLLGWRSTAAYVATGSMDILMVNEAAAALGDGRFRPGSNLVERAFSAEGRAERDWEARAARVAAELRFHGDPYDPRFQQVVGRLAIRDDDFRRFWARHDARPVPTGSTRIDVDTAAVNSATFHSFEVPGAHPLILTVLQKDDLES